MTSATGTTLTAWDVTLPDTSSSQSTVVETFIFDGLLTGASLFIVGQLYSSRPRKENAHLLSRTVEALKKEFVLNPEAQVDTALTMALARANDVLKEARRKAFSSHTLKVHMVVMATRDSDAFVSRIAHGVALRGRDGAITHLTERPLYSPDPQHHITFHSVTHTALRENDVILLGTPQMYKVGEQTLTHKNDPESLEREVHAHRADLRNLGMIALYLRERHATPPAQLENAHSPSRLATLKNTPTKPVFFAIAAVLTAGLLTWALQTEQQIVAQNKAYEALVSEVRVMEEKTEALVELENYGEAATLLESINVKLTELEQGFGESKESRQLRKRARYLSSLIPIRE